METLATWGDEQTLVIEGMTDPDAVIAELDAAEATAPTSLKTTWKSGGVDHEVYTLQNPGESVADFVARHIADVLAAQVTYPPD